MHALAFAKLFDSFVAGGGPRRLAVPFVLLGVGLFGAAGPVRATLILTHSDVYASVHRGATSNTPPRITPQVGSGIVAFELPRFDPSLGRLESVNLTLLTSNEARVTVECFGVPFCFSNGRVSSIANVETNSLSIQLGQDFGDRLVSKAVATASCTGGFFGGGCSEQGFFRRNFSPSGFWSFSRAAGDNLAGFVGADPFLVHLANGLLANSVVDGQPVGSSASALHSGIPGALFDAYLATAADDGPDSVAVLATLLILIDEALANSNPLQRGLIYSDAQYRTQFEITGTVRYEFSPIPEPSTALLLSLGLFGLACRSTRSNSLVEPARD